MGSLNVLLYDVASLAGGLKNSDNHSSVGYQRLQDEGEVVEEIHN